MKKNADIYDVFADFCLKSGIKRTAQRYAVFCAIYGNETHPKVEDVFNEVRKTLPTIKLESVYRILGDFQRAGVIAKVAIPSILRFDPNTEPHAHFVCSKCGKIMDIPSIAYELPKSLMGAENVSLILNGLCEPCAKAQ